MKTNKLNKIVITGLAVMMTISAVSINAFAGAAENDTITMDEVTYTYSVTGNELSITKISTDAEKIVVPEQLNGYSVTSIGNSACRDCAFKSVQLPDSIHTIRQLTMLLNIVKN